MTKFPSRSPVSPARRGGSIERAALFARSPRLLAKFDFIGKPPRRGGAASPAAAPLRLRRYRLIKRSMLLEHVKFALAGEREARLIRRSRREGQGMGRRIAGGRGEGRRLHISNFSSVFFWNSRVSAPRVIVQVLPRKKMSDQLNFNAVRERMPDVKAICFTFLILSTGGNKFLRSHTKIFCTKILFWNLLCFNFDIWLTCYRLFRLSDLLIIRTVINNINLPGKVTVAINNGMCRKPR